MKVLITGHQGYIGSILAPMARDAGHEITGIDTNLYDGCNFYTQDQGNIKSIQKDIRDVTAQDLIGFDAIMHLAAVSNDPIGELNEDTTYSINHRASVALAKSAKEAGIKRFLFSSSCSLYGAADTAEPLDESAAFNPVTAYGRSKVLAEQDINELASDSFSPIYLRNATAYGVSPRLRADLVVNNLTGYAVTTGEVKVKSDGTPWRPLVHIEDISRAFLGLLTAPRDVVHNRAFNVGPVDENYQISELAALVEKSIPNSVVKLSGSAGPDARSYKVDFGLLHKTLPSLGFHWNVPSGIEQLRDSYIEHGLTSEAFEGPGLQRIKTILRLLEEHKIDDTLRLQAKVEPL